MFIVPLCVLFKRLIVRVFCLGRAPSILGLLLVGLVLCLSLYLASHSLCAHVGIGFALLFGKALV